ncbi:MAG TPA: ABC transporter permease [Thermoanaerobaculia bacterium]|nr:ABC transporter permease [Thermoanaerobaculia bacterium]
MESLWQDVRFGLRQLVRDKVFSLASILTLSLGIGAVAAILTVVEAVLLKNLPYRSPSQLVVIKGTFEDKGEVKSWLVSEMDFVDWRQRSTLFSAMSIWGTFAFNLKQGQQSQRISGELVNDTYFSLLGFNRPTLGRFFTPDEDARPLEQYVVVLGENLWRTTFGADPGVLGRKLLLNGKLFEVIGVGPRGCRGMSDQADLWVPSKLPPVREFLTIRSLRWASGVARLKPGVTLPMAQRELDGTTAALSREFPDTNRGLGAALMPLKEFWLGKLNRGLLILTLGAGTLLLIACINIASLSLTRAVARQRSWGIQVALGASRGRLARRLLTESVLLSLCGAAAGLVLGQWATRALIAAGGTQFPSFVHIAMEPRVIVSTVGLAVLCGLLIGLAPLWISFRVDLSRSLGRVEKLPSRSQGWQWFQNVVVILQVALALTLSVDAVLMTKSFRARLGQNLGFRSDNLLTSRIDILDPKYDDEKRVFKKIETEYLPRIGAIPGLQQIALSDPTIPTDDWYGGFITVEDHDSDRPNGTYPASIHSVSPGYFEVLGVPIERGRGFTMQDTRTNAVIVSKAMAAEQWPGQNPIGKRIKLDTRNERGVPWLTVVGVASTVRHEGFQPESAAPAPELYLSLLQFVRRPLTVNFLLRPKPGVSTAQLGRALHRELLAIDPELPDYDMMTMQARLAKQLDKARFLFILTNTFATLALILAVIGIYGVTSYSVMQRAGEIATRMSLGAARDAILRMVVGRGAVLAVLGLALGLVAVLATSRLWGGELFQTSDTDPRVLAGTSLGLLLVTLAANYLPARRAATLDPMVSLRQ